MSSPTRDPSPFRAAVEGGDLEGMKAALAEDVSFRSPAVYKPYEGREAVSALLGVVVQVFEDFTYVGEVRDGDDEVLRFRARVGDRDIEGIDWIRTGPDGKIAELTVMIRPLSGLLATRDAMGERLAALGG